MVEYECGKEMEIKTDLKCGMLSGFAGFALTLISWYFATGVLDPRFPAVIGAGLFGGGFLGSLIKRLYKEGEERKANSIFLAVMLIVGIPLIVEYAYDTLTGNWKIWKLISIFVYTYLICYGIFRVMESRGVEK